MKRINLMEMAKKGDILETGAKPKMPIKIQGISEENLSVYQIPLNNLYYNNENGRISTAIKRLEHDLIPSYDEINPAYNSAIEFMIEEDNITALKKTKSSIKRSGQKVFGYVLTDGRIIDGNRRFTALRQLARESGKSYFFEAVVLPITYDDHASRKEIKRLELAIQMGVEERQSYDPVDLSVDVYQTVQLDKLMSKQDYAHEASMDLKEVQIRIDAVELMDDYLAFINASPMAYYIVKDAKLYNPLEELAKKLKRQYPKKGPDYEASKVASFALLSRLLSTGGDMVRDFRNYFKTVLTTKENANFVSETEDAVDDFRDVLEEKEIKSAADLRLAIDKASSSIREINESFSKLKSKQERGKNTETFINQIKGSDELLSDMVQGYGLTGSLQFSNFTESQLREIRELLVNITVNSKELMKIYEDEI